MPFLVGREVANLLSLLAFERDGVGDVTAGTTERARQSGAGSSSSVLSLTHGRGVSGRDERCLHERQALGQLEGERHGSEFPQEKGRQLRLRVDSLAARRT